MLNLKKCHFALPKLRLLRYIVLQEGLQVDPKKVKKLVDIWPPKTIIEIKSFLGLTSYYHWFIKNFAKIAAPLVKKIQKDASLKWNEEAQVSFDTLKKALTTALILCFFNLEKPFILTIDALALGLGAVLSQIQQDSKEKVVTYGSLKLKDAQASYTAT